MTQEYNLNPVSFITIATVGVPGRRVFYLQAARGEEHVTVIIEKEHALALAASLDELLAELEARFPRPSARPLQADERGLRKQFATLFRVGRMGLGYDEPADLVVIIAYQLVLEEDQEPQIARFWVTRQQVQGLRDQALTAVEGGRPTCELCGEPIEPDGHLCPRRNGHGNDPKFAR